MIRIGLHLLFISVLVVAAQAYIEWRKYVQAQEDAAVERQKLREKIALETASVDNHYRSVVWEAYLEQNQRETAYLNSIKDHEDDLELQDRITPTLRKKKED